MLTFLSAGCSSATGYEDVEELASTLVAEDLGCDELAQPDVEGQGNGIPTSSGSCAIAGEDFQQYVFDSEQDVDLWFERGRMETVANAKGANWVVVTMTQDLADRIAAALDAQS